MRDNSDEDGQTLTERVAAVGDRLASLRSGRPLTGALLLWAASALLVLIAIRPAIIQITDTSLRAPVASAGALATFAAGLVTLVWPRYSSAAGTVGTVAAFVAIPAVIALGSISGLEEMMAATVLFGAVGGIACINWRPGQSPSRSIVTRHASTVAVVFALLVVLSSGSATAGQFPRQEDSYGGFIVKLDELSADEYDFNPNCRALLDDCNDITVDTRTQTEVPAARQKLSGVTGSNAVISENLQQPDGTWINLAIRGTDLTATGDRGFDVYVSEYYNDYIKADLTVFGDAVSVPVDEIVNRWLCNPRAEADRSDPGGFGTLDDTRLGLDATPALRDGEDVYQLAHQAGSSNTLIENFELEVTNGRDDGFEINKDEPNFPDECA